jgi:glycosyltransferase involved in cell wall biosynthesis
MRILVLTDQIYPDAIGGVGKSLYNECAAMVRRSHQVTVVVRGIDHSLAPIETINNIHVVRLNGPARTSWFYYFYPILLVINFIRWLRQNPDSYHILYIHNPLLILSVKLSTIHNSTPLAYTFHSPMFQEILISADNNKYGLLNPIARIAAWILRAIEYISLRLADAIFPRSEYTEDLLLQLCPQAKIPQPLIPLGVDIHKYLPGDQIDVRKTLNLSIESSILICVRRLDYRMGLQNLVSAMVGVIKEHPETLLLIAGNGPMRETLQEQIQSLELQNHIHLLGFVSEADLPLYLAAADLFILPTEFLEGFGLATIEALSSGCPVVGTPIGATPELLNPIDPSLLTQDASPEALAERMNYWLSRRDELSALGKKCRAEVEARYDIDLVTRQLEERFQGLRHV